MRGAALTDNQETFAREFVLWYFQIQGSRSFSDSSGCVIMRAVAWTIVASEFTSICNWYASQVCAHAENDKPFGIFNALVVVLTVSKLTNIDGLLDGNFFGGSVANEERLATPFECDGFAFGDFGEFNFDLGQGEDIS